MEFDSKNVDAYTLMGYAQTLMEQIKISKKTYEKILKDIDRYDLYALCAVGNIHLIAGRNEPTKQGVSYFINIYIFYLIIKYKQFLHK